VFPVEDGAVVDVARVGYVYDTEFLTLDRTCTDCVYRYRAVYATDPRSTEQLHDPTYSVSLRWVGEFFSPSVHADELPAVTVTATPIDTGSYRVESNLVTDDTQWTAARPFDLRMVTVDIDPALVPASGLSVWPALERRAVSVIRAYSDQDGQNRSVIDDVKELDPACVAPDCLHYSYIVPIVDPLAASPAGSLSFEAMHWIDYYDDTGSERTGSVDITSAAPSAWLEKSSSGVLRLDSDDDHIVTIEFDVSSAATSGIGSGFAQLTVSPPEGIAGVTPYDARQEQPFSLKDCEHQPPCSVSFIVDGQRGDQITWNLDVAYGFFNEPDTPSQASISFSDPAIRIRH
jgi:hypothetical protein